MGFKLAALVLFFLAGGLLIRAIARKSKEGSVSIPVVILGHILAVFLGILISPNVFGIIEKNALNGLVPILDLVFGWIGFLFGFQFNVTTIRRIPRGWFRKSFIESFITFLFTGAAIVLILFILSEKDFIERKQIVISALAAAGALSVSSPTLWSFLQRSIKRPPRIFSLLNVILSTDGILGVAALALINVLWHPEGFGVFRVLLLFIGLGGGQGALIWLLLGDERRTIPIAMLTIGVLTLGAGLSSRMGIAPVVTGALAGAVTANLTPGLRQRLVKVLHTAESGLYLGALILFGLFFPGGSSKWETVGFLIAFLGFLRFPGKYIGGITIFRKTVKDSETRKIMTYSLYTEGVLSLVLALCFVRTVGGDLSAGVLHIVLFAFVMGELISALKLPGMLKTISRDKI